MKIAESPLADTVLIEPRVFEDPRGFFYETWQRQRYADAGVDVDFVQDNLSRSSRGVLRGLHYQHPHGQGKLVYVLEGEVFDVAVDIRRGSPNFGRWAGVTLSSANRRQFYIPPGFAHGFCVVSETALFTYKCSEYYHPETDHSIAWNDPAIGIDWPFDDPELSAKDAAGIRLADMPEAELPEYRK